MKKSWLAPLRWWLFAALPITALSIGIYSVGQQVLRQSINDVPVQMAEDIAAGAPAPTGTVDIAQSLSPFVIIYDKNFNPIGGNGYLNGSYPTPPAGVFSSPDFWSTGHSWEPSYTPEVRVDVAIIPTASGYVLAGRNMRLMELHIEHLGELVLLGWLATLVATLVWGFAVQWVYEKAL